MSRVELTEQQLGAFKNPSRFSIDRVESVGINNVFGVSKDGILPARFGSGFLPTFELAERVQRETDGKVEPEVRIFIPSSINQHGNGSHPELVERQISSGTALIKALAQRRFPTVKFFLEQDKPIDEEALKVLAAMSTTLYDFDPEKLSKIVENGRRRGGEQGAKNALLYAAHHPFGWSDLHTAAIFEKKPPFTVINTQPPSERPYAEIREHIKRKALSSSYKELVCEGERFDLVMNMCGVPHYLLITDHDNGKMLEPNMDDLLATSGGQILYELQRRREEASHSGLKENLRRARADMERFLSALGKSTDTPAAEVNVRDLIPNAESVIR